MTAAQWLHKSLCSVTHKAIENLKDINGAEYCWRHFLCLALIMLAVNLIHHSFSMNI